MLYVEFLVDDEPYELELRPGMVFTKCTRCGKKIYGYFQVDDETELLCESCTPPPPDPKKKLIEYLKKHVGVTFTEEEMDTFLRRAIPNYCLTRSTGVRRFPIVGRIVAPLGRPVKRVTIPL